jgi:uncharacterized protein (DUF608 family)
MKRTEYPRRDFLKKSSVLAAGWVAGAGKTFKLGESLRSAQTIPLKKLMERGKVTTYLKSREELQYIGMPVGGINTGTLYLGGDGRLWLWDIFNLNQEGINPVDVPWKDEVHAGKKIRSRDGSAYIAPPRAEEIMPLAQGFAIQLEYDGKKVRRNLCADDWEEVAFEATYPVATITYSEKHFPFEVVLQAYSPFIPLDEDKSGLPATIFSIGIKNNTSVVANVVICGWLENKAALHTAATNRVQRVNTVFRDKDHTGVFSTLEKTGFGNKHADKSFDFGTLCIAALGRNAGAVADVSGTKEAVFQTTGPETATKSAQQKLIGNVTESLSVSPGDTVERHFVISWHTPNFMIHDGKVLPEADRGRYYDNSFKNAKEVAAYVAGNFKELSSTTLLWKKTWYDSTLPYWFLERTFVNIAALATTTSHRFKSGRYWAWEGVGACEGNCTHVWQYAQAPARIFPAMERDNRERVDLGVSLQENGGIWFRGEYDKRPAIDGQAGRILGCYREHQLSRDHHFLERNWTKIKKATQFILNQDRNNDGMEDTPLENTLDAIWDGEIAWIVGLCIAAVKAAQAMAEEMEDTDFARVCKKYVEAGKKNMEEKLFNGEYFIHRPDAEKGRSKLGSYNTCHIDQVYGQSWIWQVGLERVLDKEKTLSALRALWKYNFKEDVGPYIEKNTGGRPYALAGEAGMVMNTNPKNESKPYGDNVSWQLGYFHECMTGFEHQVASHMMAEGMIKEALTLTRAIHDRYHAAKRNPFNEIECSDHYGRAMASYGTFLSACGFKYHGPKGYIRFAPKWSKENFKAAFTAAEGWGCYEQKIGEKQQHFFSVKYGTLQLQTIGIDNHLKKFRTVTASIDGRNISLKYSQRGNELEVVLNTAINVGTGQTLVLVIA